MADETATGRAALSPRSGAPRSALSSARSALLPPMADADRSLYRDLLVIGGGFALVTALAYVARLSFHDAYPRDGSSLIIGRDFVNLWMYGRAALGADPGRWYDLASYHAALRDLLGMELNGQNWSYPPTVMWLAAPFGALPYLVALAAWSVIGPLLLLRAARLDLAEPRILAVVMVSPAAVFCLICGQSAFLTTALLVAIFALLDRRPVVAGCLIALLTIKPQLGLLFPVLLAATGRWRVFAAASVAALALAAITAMVFGTASWRQFIALGLPVQSLVLADPDGIATPFFPTLYMNLRGIGVGPQWALAVQGVLALAAAASVALAGRWAGETDQDLVRAQFLAASVSASPYLLDYDLLPLTYAAVALLAAGRLDGAGRRLAQAVFWMAALQLALGSFRIPGAALIAPLFATYLIWRLKGSGRQSGGAAIEPPAAPAGPDRPGQKGLKKTLSAPVPIAAPVLAGRTPPPI